MGSIYGPANFQSPAFLQGIKPTSFTNTTAVYSVGSARAFTNDWVMEYPGTIANLPGSITINTATIGINGCYPLALSAVTPVGGLAFVPVYFCGSSSGTTDGSLSPLNGAPGLVIATSSTGFAPPGYEVFRQVGFVLVNSTGNLVPYAMGGNYLDRTVILQDAQQTLSAGAVVGPTKVDLILGTSGSNLPSASISAVNLLYTFTPNNAADVATLIPHGLTSGSKAPIEIKTNGTAAVTGNVQIVPGNDAGICAVDYGLTSTSDSLSLWIAGFTFSAPFV